jgi:hypothetical protein
MKPWIFSLATCALWLSACGSSKGSSDSGADSDSRSAVDTGVADVHVGIDTNTSSGDTAASDGASDTPTAILVPFDGQVNEDTACASVHFTANATPPILSFVIDRSGSMANLPTAVSGSDASLAAWDFYYPQNVTNPGAGSTLCTNTSEGAVLSDTVYPTTKFGLLRSALDTLFSPGGLTQTWQAAVTFFPAAGHWNDADDGCNDSLYSTPAIALGTIANNLAAVDCWTGFGTNCAGVTNSTTETNTVYCNTSNGLFNNAWQVPVPPILPAGFTPMAAGLTGAIAYLKGLTTDANGKPIAPGTPRVAVLITDGVPEKSPSSTTNECALQSGVEGVAAMGFNGTPPVITYAVGIPGSIYGFLAQVAAVGGGYAFDLTNNPNFGPALVTDIESIGQQQLSCSFAVPTPPAGDTIDPNAVAVTLTANNQTLYVPHNPNGGWDYTNGGQQITLFGAACDTLRTDVGAQIEILFACESLQYLDAGHPACGTSDNGVTGCSSQETSCCFGYYCDSATDACLKNGVVIN